jgi:hypothetical protein
VLDIATALAGVAEIDVMIGICRAPLHEARSDEMFQVATCLTALAVIAVLDQVLDLDCAKSCDVCEGLDLRIAKIRAIEFSWFWLSSRRSALIGGNLGRGRLVVRGTATYAMPPCIRRQISFQESLARISPLLITNGQAGHEIDQKKID